MAVTAPPPMDSASASWARPPHLDARGGLAAPGSSTQTVGPTSRAYLEALADLTERWERGETPGVELYLDGATDWTASQIVELIYREFRLADIAGLQPSSDAFLARFPAHREALEPLLRLDGACSDALIRRLFKSDAEADQDALLPQAGDEIGPYILKRELGRGGFARVFLAEQADLEYRLVVVKISTRITREPWLLARARHPHIVEVLSQDEVDDGALQMICMPFRGGATLSAILARRRERPRGKNSDRRLIADLDAVAAPEYSESRSARPAREALDATADPRAFAWIAARLADALDHANSQGVIHGDVKPSNILLTADGNPMLLDFNLARDEAFRDPDAPVEAPGGTLAYMAPERLRLIAEASLRSRPGRTDATAPDPHRADVYSLGVVLLEAVAGWSPAAGGRHSDQNGPRGFGEAAERFAQVRERGAVEIVRAAEKSAGRTIEPTLRSILLHCLDADPRARYGRGLELATDLDRWLADRPLVFAPEPSRRRAIGRWTKRNRRGVAIAALALSLSLLTASVFVALGEIATQDRAVEHLGLNWDDVVTPPFHFQREGFPTLRGRDSVGETQTALRALKTYQVLEPGDWRARDDYRGLPTAARDELELWLVEQAYRAARSLAARPDAPDDWRRARTLLDRVCETAAPSVVAALRDRLDARLDTPARHASAPAAPCVEEYLQGIAAELDNDEGAAARGPSARPVLDPKTDPWAEVRRGNDLGAGLTEALKHYRRLLAMRPDSFWGRYRSATIAFRLGRWEEAAADIETCLRVRPKNAILHGFLATCLFNLDRSDAALEASNRALDAAPDHADFVQTRAFIRSGLPTTEGLRADIRRYEMLKSLIPESFFRTPTLKDLSNPVAASVAASRRGMPLARPRKSRPINGDAPIDLVELDLGELTSRAVFAARLWNTGKTAIAAVEIDKVLALDPGFLAARVDHMCLAIDEGRFLEARDDLDLIVDDPMLVEYIDSNARRVEVLLTASRKLAFNGEIGDAMKLAQKTLQLTQAARMASGRSLYTLAQIESVAARTEPRWIATAAKHLRQAVANHASYEQWFQQDPTFAPVRAPIRAELDALRGL